jgi:hypothetical protein
MRLWTIALSFVALGLAACNSEPEKPALRDELLDPANCAECHPIHYDQWLSSMHAYAAEDPVFRAMNAKGQRETNGELGDFCVKCHAPLAVELGYTEDGLNLDEVPQHLQGVTCYFCHNVEAVEGSHNNPVRLALDGVMRGWFSADSAVDNDFHAAEFSRFTDGRTPESAQLCGSCHDIVTPGGGHIERTFLEWNDSLYSELSPTTGNFQPFAQSCATCHERAIDNPVAEYEGVGSRTLHSHGYVGVDVAITDFPDAEQAAGLREYQLEQMEQQRASVLCSSACVKDVGMGAAELTVWLHNEASGHSWPSGAGADRRAWVEVQAFGDDPSSAIYASGVVAQGESIDAVDDGYLWLMKDTMYDADGLETHDFWEAVSYETALLPAPEQFAQVSDDTAWISRTYPLPEMPTSVQTRVRLRPMAYEILDELIASGDLDPAHRDAFPTFDLENTELTWPGENAVEVEGFGTCAYVTTGCMAPPIREVVGGP